LDRRSLNCLTVLLVCAFFLVSCITTPDPGSQARQASACDPKSYMARLKSSGLFASQELVYSQAHVASGVIHPAMQEKQAVGSLGLYHAFEPDQSGDELQIVMKEIGAQALIENFVDPRVTPGSSVLFESSNQALNLFAIEGQRLNGLKTIDLKVPDRSSAIIVIRGETVALQGMRFQGFDNPSKILFILPEARAFSVQGEILRGTVIAPKARVQIDAPIEGSVFAAGVRAMMVAQPILYDGCMFP
jgi:hypothetical protein